MTTNTKNIFLITLIGVLHHTSVPVHAQSAPASVAKLLTDNPYRFVGRLIFTAGSLQYIGSAVVIKPSSLLTAGHNLYAEGTGWNTEVTFDRSYDYDSYSSRSSASSVFLIGGYASLADNGKDETNAGFSRDMGGIVCFSKPANGLYASWKLGKSLLTSSVPKMSLGYGAEVNSGEELLRSSSARPFYKVSGSFYETKYFGIEGGMSGGPVFAKSGGKWYVCAVNVSAPGRKIFNRGAGVRMIDADAATLIRNVLK
jgi:hypothetical protein